MEIEPTGNAETGLLAALRCLRPDLETRIERLFQFDAVLGPEMLQGACSVSLDLPLLDEALGAFLPSLAQWLVPEVRASVASRQLAHAAGRLCAERCLQTFGVKQRAVLREPTGEPIWPTGFQGSIAHSEITAIALVLRNSVGHSIAAGVDIERLGIIDSATLSVFSTTDERQRWSLENDMEAATILFSAKEAYFKAAYRSAKRFIDFDEMTVDRWDRGLCRVVLVPSTNATTPLPVGHCRYRLRAEQVIVAASIIDPWQA